MRKNIILMYTLNSDLFVKKNTIVIFLSLTEVIVKVKTFAGPTLHGASWLIRGYRFQYTLPFYGFLSNDDFR